MHVGIDGGVSTHCVSRPGRRLDMHTCTHACSIPMHAGCVSWPDLSTYAACTLYPCMQAASHGPICSLYPVPIHACAPAAWRPGRTSATWPSSRARRQGRGSTYATYVCMYGHEHGKSMACICTWTCHMASMYACIDTSMARAWHACMCIYMCTWACHMASACMYMCM